MVDVPCLDHLWDGQKNCLDVGQVRCFHEETSRKLLFWKGDTKESDRIPAKTSLVYLQPLCMKDKPETPRQPTMSIKWNSGSLLDMEAHMPSATQNNSKRTKRNMQERRNILNHNGPEANLQLNT